MIPHGGKLMRVIWDVNGVTGTVLVELTAAQQVALIDILEEAMAAKAPGAQFIALAPLLPALEATPAGAARLLKAV